MKKSFTNDSSKVDRKTIEKNRRIQMKGLCFKLASLIPKHHNFYKDILTQQDILDHATIYIKDLRERVENLKNEKELLLGSNSIPNSQNMPVLELRDMGSILEVALVSNLNKNFMFYQVIDILEEEGVGVVNASFSVVDDKIYHTFHSQVVSARVGMETTRIFQRLKDLVY